MYTVFIRDAADQEWREDSQYEDRTLAEAQAQRWIDAGREAEVLDASKIGAASEPAPNSVPAPTEPADVQGL